MEEEFKDLKRRIATTANNRFNASTRLNRHNQYSLYIVIAFSLGLILASITNTLNINAAVNTLFLNASSIFFSVAILTISTALSMSKFGVRAEKYHDCGRELHALALELEKIIRNNPLQTTENYEKYQNKYELILSRYDNHNKIDHMFTKLAWDEEYHPKWYRWPITYARLWLEYSIYIILFIIEIIWLAAIYTPLIKNICL